MFLETEKRPQGEERTDRESIQPLDEASKLLLKAADYIERHGWCQGKAYETNEHGFPGPACMYGALWRSTGEYHARKEAEDRLNNGCGVFFVAKWNDEPGRTKEEVIAKLRAVALGG